MIRTLLSVKVGAPLALTAMALLFFVEYFIITGRKRPRNLDHAVKVVTSLVLVIVIARFAKYA